MAKYVHPDVLDGGLLAIKNNAAKILLISNYAAGDSYATVTGNKLAEVAVTAADYTLGTSSTSRTLTAAAKTTGNATASAATPNLHIAHTDGASRVLWVTDETSDQPITAGNPCDIPSHTHTSNQPT